MSQEAKTPWARVAVQLAVVIVLIPLLPLLISGRWGWGEAWVYAGIWIGGFAVSRALAARRHPDLLRERARMLWHEDTVAWDRWLAPVVGIGAGLIPLVAGLNARFAPDTALGGAVKAAALVVILAAYALGTWAMMENRFFSGVVRLQTERGHTVVSSGPYAWVRHPGYAGALLTYLATPVWLEAPWALLAAGLIAAVLVVRTSLEDRWLRENLEGYAAYAGRVRWRLVPGVW